LLTSSVLDAMQRALHSDATAWRGSFDLGERRKRRCCRRRAGNGAAGFCMAGQLKDRSIHWFDGDGWQPASRYAGR
jgi:hypothetical protein